MASNSRTQAGELLRAKLAPKGEGATARLAEAVNVSPQYLSMFVTGARPVPPSWLDTMAQALELTPEERQDLHRRAARDAGFKVDL